ncbi:hypothetical protein K438DRAFT_1769655 [Mycena galopus ATCC 62051]|nr:hypothetical protein K438DRAFT_1769655 [Mycena galopus ATCC 62051]
MSPRIFCHIKGIPLVHTFHRILDNGLRYVYVRRQLATESAVVDKILDLSDKIIILTARVDAEELEATTGKRASSLELDLISLSSAKAAAEVFQRLERKLDSLINKRVYIPVAAFPTLNNLLFCRGEMNPPADAVTSDGHYYFVRLLLSQLLAAGSSRIVHLGSHGHTLADGIKWGTIKDGPERQKTMVFDLYYQSKFLYVQYNCTQGALTFLFAATSPEALNANGKVKAFCSQTYGKPPDSCPWARFGKPYPEILNIELGAKLWAWLEEETKDVP